MLKILAAALMLVDHVGLVFFPRLAWVRMVGRVSMPLFAYAIATGYYFTARKQAALAAGSAPAPVDAAANAPQPRQRSFDPFLKYLLQMAAFALVSQWPFMLMRAAGRITSFGMSIGVTWLLALVMLHGVLSRRAGWLLAAIGAAALAMWLPIDYGIYGVLYPLACYPVVLAVQQRRRRYAELSSPAPLYLGGGAAQVGLNALGWVGLGFWPFQALSLAAFPLMCLDSGAKSRISKWFFYIFYPAHMLALWALAMLW